MAILHKQVLLRELVGCADGSNCHQAKPESYFTGELGEPCGSCDVCEGDAEPIVAADTRKAAEPIESLNQSHKQQIKGLGPA